MYSTVVSGTTDRATDDAGDGADAAREAFEGLAGAEAGRWAADEALAGVERAWLLSGFALAAEAEAVARLLEVYPYVSKR